MFHRVWAPARAVAVTALSIAVLAGAAACRTDQQSSGGEAAAPVDTATTAASENQPSTPEAAPATSAPPPATSAPPATTAAPPQSNKPPATTKPAAPAGCAQGERQLEVEQNLAKLGGFGPVTVDGVQSPADCAAIKKFQQRYGISPAEGRAGPTTGDVAKRLGSTGTDQCAAGSGTTVCVNLTLQTMWVMRDGKVVMGPTVTRTGMRGYATPAGTFKIDSKATKEWSVPYKVWLPYWQHFKSGMGFHETTTYLHNMPNGSHGCVNLLHADAVQLWGLTQVGTRVVLFGHRPGT